MKLKSESGKDIIVYGGATFDSSLIEAGLIDEFHLLINPVAIGSGMAIFKDLKEVQKFTMIKSTPFDSGIAELHLEPKRTERYTSLKPYLSTINQLLVCILDFLEYLCF